MDRDKLEKAIQLEDCPFCKGTGVAKCFDFSKNDDLADGSHDLNDLIKDKGTYTECPEGCKPMN